MNIMSDQSKAALALKNKSIFDAFRALGKQTGYSGFIIPTPKMNEDTGEITITMGAEDVGQASMIATIATAVKLGRYSSESKCYSRGRGTENRSYFSKF